MTRSPRKVQLKSDAGLARVPMENRNFAGRGSKNETKVEYYKSVGISFTCWQRKILLRFLGAERVFWRDFLQRAILLDSLARALLVLYNLSDGYDYFRVARDDL